MKRSFWSFFIDHYRLTYLIIVGTIIFGVISIIQIPKESSPEVDFPVFVISTQLPGASAEDVESLVTDVIESRLQGVTDIDTITSTSYQGFSQIVASFDVDADSQEKLMDINERVDAATPNLPDDASDPRVQQISFNDVPIATFGLSGPYEPEELKAFAGDIEEDIERIPDVSLANVIGAPEPEIRVTLLPERLDQYGLSALQVSAAVAQSNVDVPIGSIETAGDVFTLRFAGRLQTAEDVRNISIVAKDGVPVKLGDIAEVESGYSEIDTLARLGLPGSEPQNAVFIDIFKRSGEGDIITIVDEATRIVEGAKAAGLPEDVEVTVTRDDAKMIRADLASLTSNGIQTIILIIVSLVIFLGWREALLTSLSVPLTYLITFAVITYIGLTINFLTLFSLILALGILVDAATVVVESMFQKMSAGSTAHAAAVDTLREFEMPLIAGTLTTVFVFLPMLLMTGIIGKFIESIPITVTVVLIAAIFVALGLVTTLATRFLHVKRGESEGGVRSVKAWIDRTYAWYGRKLDGFMRDVKKSKRFLYAMALLFILTIALPVMGVIEVVMFTDENLDFISVSLENPIGTPLSATNAMAEEIEAVLGEDPRVKNFVTRVGAGASEGSIETGGASSHLATFLVNLVEERDQTSTEIIADLEKKLVGLVPGEVTVGQLASGPPTGTAVQARLVGESLEDLEAAAYILADYVRSIPGTKNVDDGVQEGNGELVFEIDRAKASTYGVTEIQAAQALRTAVSGSQSTTIHTDGDDVTVIVTSRLGNEASVGSISQATIDDLNSISVMTTRGPMPISTFGEVRLAPSRSSIAHEDGDRVITVRGDVETGVNAQNVTTQIQESIGDLGLPESVTVEFGGEAEDIAESFTSLGQAMVIGILMIIALLTWQFRSYRQAFIIILTIPLALIGVFIGLALTGQAITFPGFIGIVALAGIVVNNAIILIDSINSDRREGLSKIDAITRSAKSRLQPIILTTLTTVIGVVPLAFSNPTWAPIAIAIMFGLTFSTVLTLVVIPIMYLLYGEKTLDPLSDGE